MTDELVADAALIQELRPKGILFLCVANSARSQLAEGIARSIAPAWIEVYSAGSEPGRVRPEAISVLAEIGIDISAHRAKAIDEIPAHKVDLVITLCAEENCPAALGGARRLHWKLPDPAAPGLPDPRDERLAAFRATRDELRRRLSLVFEGLTA